MQTGVYKKQICFLLLLSFQCFHLTGNAQFNLEWAKPIALKEPGLEVKEVTCVNNLNDANIAGIVVNKAGKNFPGIAYISKADKVSTLMFSNRSMMDYRIAGFSIVSGDTMIAYCNDFARHDDTLPQLRPANIRFYLKDGELEYISNTDERLVVIDGVTDCHYLDIYHSSASVVDVALLFKGPAVNYVKLFKFDRAKPSYLQTIQEAQDLKIWFDNDDTRVLSIHRPYSAGGERKYYNISIWNKDFKAIQQYPPEVSLPDSNGMDELVYIDYKPDYQLGYTTRQIHSIQGKNLLNWYGFSGFEKGKHSGLIGEKDVLVAAGITLGINDKVVDNWQVPDLPGGYNWVLTEDSTYKSQYQLIFSIDNYVGLRLSKLRVGDANTADAADTNQSHSGLGNIHPQYGMKSFTRHANTELYIVANLTGNENRKPGIYLQKWKLDVTDEKLGRNFLTNKYKQQVWFGDNVISETDSRQFTLVDIDPADENYEKLNKLADQPIQIITSIEQVPNTWFWKGKVKIGKKKFDFTRFVIARSK